jgi:hypothetical protein
VCRDQGTEKTSYRPDAGDDAVHFVSGQSISVPSCEKTNGTTDSEEGYRHISAEPSVPVFLGDVELLGDRGQVRGH